MYKRKTVDKYILDAWKIALTAITIVLAIVLFQRPQNKPDVIISPLVVNQKKPPQIKKTSQKISEPSSLPTNWQKNTNIIIKEFAPLGKKVVLEALLVSWQESGWRSNAIHKNKNNTYDKGLWQFNSQYHTNDKCSFNPECSTKKAVELYKKQGWKPWYGRGILKKFLKKGKMNLKNN